MFLTLLLVTFLVSFLVSQLFGRRIRQILLRASMTSGSPVGCGSGRWSITSSSRHDERVLLLTSDRWTFELFPTVVRGLELRRESRG